jgi:hypothetical protein
MQVDPVAQVTTLCSPARAQEGGCSILEHLGALWLSSVSPMNDSSARFEGGQHRTKRATRLACPPSKFGTRFE